MAESRVVEQWMRNQGCDQWEPHRRRESPPEYREGPMDWQISLDIVLTTSPGPYSMICAGLMSTCHVLLARYGSAQCRYPSRRCNEPDGSSRCRRPTGVLLLLLSTLAPGTTSPLLRLRWTMVGIGTPRLCEFHVCVRYSVFHLPNKTIRIHPSRSSSFQPSSFLFHFACLPFPSRRIWDTRP